MYLKQNDIQLLVNALSKAEKKSLTLYLSTLPKTSGKNYISLLDSIYKGIQPYELKAKCAPQAETNAKRRLYKNILKSLRSHHDKKSIDILISNLLCEVEILYDLSLPAQAMVMLRRAYHHAQRFEKYGLLLQIFEWERKLNMVLNKPERPNVEIEKEEQEVLEKLNEILLFKNAFVKIREMKRKYGYIKNMPLEKAQMETLIAGLPQIKSDASQKTYHYYHHTLAIYNWMIFNHVEAYRNSKKLLSERMQKILHNDFLEGIFEHITSCVCIGKFREALSSMDMADRYIAKQKYDQSPTFLLRTFYFKIIYKLLVYYYMGDVEKLALSIKEAEDKLHLFDIQLSMEMKQVIYSNLKNAYAVLGNINKSGQIVEEVLKKGPKATRKDMYDDATLFNLFILLQTKTYVLLPSAALSAKRYFKQFIQDGNYNDVEFKIASILQKERNWEDKSTREVVLQEIGMILESCIAETVGLNNFQEFYTYFIIWTNSLISGRPLQEEAAAWYRQYKGIKSEAK